MNFSAGFKADGQPDLTAEVLAVLYQVRQAAVHGVPPRHSHQLHPQPGGLRDRLGVLCTLQRDDLENYCIILIILLIFFYQSVYHVKKNIVLAAMRGAT